MSETKPKSTRTKIRLVVFLIFSKERHPGRSFRCRLDAPGTSTRAVSVVGRIAARLADPSARHEGRLVPASWASGLGVLPASDRGVSQIIGCAILLPPIGCLL